MKRVMIGLAIVGALGASVAVAETLFVTAPAVNIYSGMGASYDLVRKAEKGDALTVIDREDEWVKVEVQVEQATKQGFVFNRALSAEKPDLTGFTGSGTGTVGLSADAAGKGLGPDATHYANSKHLNKAPLNQLLTARDSITQSECQAFATAGKVGKGR